MINNPLFKRFWFEFDSLNNNVLFGAGIGVTGYNYDDVIEIITIEIFKNMPIPEIKKLIENIDVSTLDARHILPNIGPPNVRGIWFPRLYLH